MEANAAPNGDHVAAAPAVEGAIAWHSLALADVLARTGSTTDGLTAQQVATRATQFGPNTLHQADPRDFLHVLIGQFRSFIVWLLLGAAAVSGLLGQWIDFAAITAIVALNALLGAWQEYSAERSIAALKRLTAPQAKVRRAGRTLVVASADLVPGDLVLLESGDLVPGDARLLEAASLACVEKALTGESEPAAKSATRQVEPAATLADRSSMVYMGTSVATGTARAVVVATGMRTEMGRIAGLIESAGAGEETPLQARLRRVGHMLVVASLVVVGALFALGFARGEPILALFLVAVSLAVAAVPEGLPAIVTVALAIGVRRMAQRKALIRRLPAVETLGSTTVICTDKTGTLTVGEMTVRAAIVAGRQFEVLGEGYSPEGGVAERGHAVPARSDPLLLVLARNLAGCTRAEVVVRDGVHEAVGDPTEAAMVVAAVKMGLDRTTLDLQAPRVGEVPFDSDRKRACVVRRLSAAALEVLVNGSPESVLARCTHWRWDSGVVVMSDADRTRALEQNAALAAKALRVLACARRELTGAAAEQALQQPLTAEELERDLTFVGLVGMYDPPRAEARDAVRSCRAAGISVVMITGDQPRTAHAIAQELGLADAATSAMSGAELQQLDEATLAARVADFAVFARVTAADKLRIVRAWQAQRAVVAMTGDGVNDAPALRGADVGVAMGRSGTDVAKQAADMVVTDDNFASIVAAVEEGRGVYDNIRKTLLFLLGCNAAEILLMAVCGVAGLPTPLLPVQILWINLVTDGLPALFLAADPVAPNVMQRKPRPRTASIMDGEFLATLVLTALMTTAVAFAVYFYGLSIEDERMARTHAFAALVFSELLISFGCRDLTVPMWRLAWSTNLMLAVVVAASCVLQIWSHHNETFTTVMGTSMLEWTECATIFLLGCIPVSVLELTKWIRSRHATSRA
ncbi:MAG TPA: cation-translocating P-type ATPase [Planctomycetota bacterium]